METTLAMIKPDGVRRGLIGEIIKRIEDADIKIISMQMNRLSLGDAEEFYAVHKDSKHFEPLVEFTASDVVVLMVLEGENVIKRWRSMLGPTDSSTAKSGTIRGDFGSTEVIRENVAHGSDSKESAMNEIGWYYEFGSLGVW